MRISHQIVRFIKSLELLYIFLLSFQIIVVGVAFFAINDGALFWENKPFDQAVLIWLLIFLLTYFSYNTMKSKYLHRIKMEPSRNMMVRKYKYFLMLRIGLMEIPLVAGIILFLFTFNSWLLLGVVICSLLYIPLKPSVEMMMEDLRLRESDLLNQL